MSISGGTISGTPSVYALNQTYTIYANQSGYSTTHELYFSVDTDNAHTVVENQTIDPIGFHPPFNNGTTAWTVSPTLPGNLSINTSTGEITGTVNGTLTNTTYTVTATHSGSGAATETFTFNLRSLADYDVMDYQTTYQAITMQQKDQLLVLWLTMMMTEMVCLMILKLILAIMQTKPIREQTHLIQIQMAMESVTDHLQYQEFVLLGPIQHHLAHYQLLLV